MRVAANERRPEKGDAGIDDAARPPNQRIARGKRRATPPSRRRKR